MTRSIVAIMTLAALAGLAAADPALHFQERVLVDAGGGYKGPWRMNDSVFEYVDDPGVAMSGNGSMAVVWVDQARKDVFYQRYGPADRPVLPEPVNVSRSGEVFSWLPRLVVSGPDAADVFVLWQEIIFSGGSHGGDILFARSRDGGRSFSRPRNLSADRAGSGKGRLTRSRWDNGSLALAGTPGGTLYASWTDYEGSLWFTRSTDGGGTFAAPQALVSAGDAAAPARGPAIATAGDQVAHLAWSVGGDNAADIRVAHSRDAGRTFSEPGIVHPSAGHSDAPRIAVDSAGTLHLLYAESPAGPGQRYHVVYARQPDRGEPFTEPAAISTPLSRGLGASFPAIATGADRRLYALWELFPPASPRPRGLGYAVSDDGGTTWSPPAVVPGSLAPDQGINGSLQGLFTRKLAANARGDVAVVNSTFRPGEGSRVWLLPAHPR